MKSSFDGKMAIERAKFLMDSLCVYRGILKDRLLVAFQGMIESFSDPEPQFGQLLASYHAFCSVALERGWLQGVFDLILNDENPFSQEASRQGSDGIGNSLRHLAGRDLAFLHELVNIPSKVFKAVASDLVPLSTIPDRDNLAPKNWPEWEEFARYRPESGESGLSNASTNYLATERSSLYLLFEKAQSWEEVTDELAKFYGSTGCGLFSQYLAFRWAMTDKGGRLEGITALDSIRLEDLIGLESQKETVLTNTEHFLQGRPANNIILYGNRGTGKSSLVKALLPAYAERGLRLVEMSKDQLGELPTLARTLAKQKLKFIVFVDDLSFDEGDSDYRSLKTILEGGLEVKPTNLLIYATSNRRHLVRESHGDRLADDIHARDTIEEQLSLADRFGITVTFPSPDQQEYLQIVEGLAARRGLAIPPEELREQALRWAMWHNGRSGRSARQFIDDLTAKMGLTG